MRTLDLDRVRSEMSHSQAEFLKLYNENLPAAFPPATNALLKQFAIDHANLFKTTGTWSLDIHRKKVMDWLRARPVVAKS